MTSTRVIGRRTILTTGVTLGGAALLRSAGLRAETPPTANVLTYPVPKLTSLPDPIHQGLTVWDVRPLGYVAEEYLVSGTSPVFQPIMMADDLAAYKVRNTPQAVDYSKVLPANFATPPITAVESYTTRILVFRPADMKKFSGNVILETLHPYSVVGDGHAEIFSMLNRFFCKRGDVVVHIQHPFNFGRLKEMNPQRYSPVHVALASQFWGTVAQVGLMMKSGKGSPLKVPARRLYLTGYSFTAQMTMTFALYHHNDTRLPGGAPVFDGYVPGTAGGAMPDRDVPIVAANTQSEVRGPAPWRETFDSDAANSRRRRYEIPGACHAPLPEPEVDGAISPSVISSTLGAVDPCRTNFPAASAQDRMSTRPVLEGMFYNISEWVDRGVAPPRAPLMELGEDGLPKLDQDGNAIGGLRMPDMAVPVKQYYVSHGACSQAGYELPFTRERLVQLYGSKTEYLKRYDAVADKLVEDRFILAEEASRLKVKARETPYF